MINDEEAPNEGEDSLDDTEDTGSEETSASTGDTDRTEESRRVVVDGVDTATSSALATKLSRVREKVKAHPVPFCHMKREVVMSIRRKRNPFPKT